MVSDLWPEFSLYQHSSLSLQSPNHFCEWSNNVVISFSNLMKTFITVTVSYRKKNREPVVEWLVILGGTWCKVDSPTLAGNQSLNALRIAPAWLFSRLQRDLLGQFASTFMKKTEFSSNREDESNARSTRTRTVKKVWYGSNKVIKSSEGSYWNWCWWCEICPFL